MDHLRRDGAGSRSNKLTWVVILSYITDWIILLAAAAIGYVLGDISPNMRPFSLLDPSISFPYAEEETVPVSLLIIIVVLGPIVFIAIISLVFVPGSTVPPGTPQSLIWKRKLWELHQGLLGLALSIVGAWFITNGMKNLFGRPRPDLLSRCEPDMDNMTKYIVGGYPNQGQFSQLVSATICQQKDKHKLDDGFRSYPSGHSSSSAAGMIYLSLFIASKFAITIPFFTPGQGANAESALAAFPSRTAQNPSSTARAVGGAESYELPTRGTTNSQTRPFADPTFQKSPVQYNQAISAVRRQAAAPPIYLLVIALVPTFTAIFIASSRWFDFRHHGFDILFGFFIGTVTAVFAFRYYHLPISRGAGWAWGPRSHDKAFWAGVGSYSYATDRLQTRYRSGDEEEAIEVDQHYGQGTGLNFSAPQPGVTRSERVGTAGSGNTAVSGMGRKPQPQSLDVDDQDTRYMGSAH